MGLEGISPSSAVSTNGEGNKSQEQLLPKAQNEENKDSSPDVEKETNTTTPQNEYTHRPSPAHITEGDPPISDEKAANEAKELMSVNPELARIVMSILNSKNRNEIVDTLRRGIKDLKEALKNEGENQEQLKGYITELSAAFQLIQTADQINTEEEKSPPDTDKIKNLYNQRNEQMRACPQIISMIGTMGSAFNEAFGLEGKSAYSSNPDNPMEQANDIFHNLKALDKENQEKFFESLKKREKPTDGSEATEDQILPAGLSEIMKGLLKEPSTLKSILIVLAIYLGNKIWEMVKRNLKEEIK